MVIVLKHAACYDLSRNLSWSADLTLQGWPRAPMTVVLSAF